MLARLFGSGPQLRPLQSRSALTKTFKTSGLGACDASARRTCSKESPEEAWPMTWAGREGGGGAEGRGSVSLEEGKKNARPSKEREKSEEKNQSGA